MPDGLLETVPRPDRETLSVTGGCAVKVPVTLRAWVINTVQLLVPEQPPPVQPAKVEPIAGVAVN
jgi:hypothetical protein